LREHHKGLFRDEAKKRHFHERMFHGFDFDNTMLRIGNMNMALHGVENANITYRDSLAEDNASDAGTYSLILANPPFAGSLDYEATAKDLQQIVKTRKTELLFMALFIRLLKIGGRAAVVVPDGVLFGWDIERGGSGVSRFSLAGGDFREAGVAYDLPMYSQPQSLEAEQALQAGGYFLPPKSKLIWRKGWEIKPDGRRVETEY
jgi:hypothetical protein